MEVNACSTFAIYGDKIYYGMNWDYYPGYDATIYINKAKDMKVFCVFDQDGNHFTGFNTKGMFVNEIMVYPKEDFGIINGFKHNGLKKISMKDVFEEALYKYSKVEEINGYLKDKKLTNLNTHDMFADRFGKAEAVEAGKDKNMITRNKDKFFLMSNFSLYYYKNIDYKNIFDRGSDRYIAGYDYILKNFNGFNISKGIEMLKAMKCIDVNFNTLCSFLYEQETNCVYIAINMDYSKVWKLSIQDETIETYKGFKTPMKVKINGNISLSDLKKLSTYNPSALKKFGNRFIIKQ